MTEANGMGRFSTIIVSFIAISVLIVIGLQAATLYFYLTEDEKDPSNQTSPSVQLPLHDFLRQSFPGRFYTDAEIEQFTRSFANVTSPELNATISDEFKPKCVDDYCEIVMAEIHSCCCIIKSGTDASCSCIPNPILTSAVYVIDEKLRVYGVGYFYLGQTCKGLNT